MISMNSNLLQILVAAGFKQLPYKGLLLRMFNDQINASLELVSTKKGATDLVVCQYNEILYTIPLPTNHDMQVAIIEEVVHRLI